MIKRSSSISSIMQLSILLILLFICDVNGMNPEHGQEHGHHHASGSNNESKKFVRCSICDHALKLEDISALKCGHTFHNKCIEKWINEGHKNCPSCEMKADSSNIIRLFIDGSNKSTNVDDEHSNLFGKCSTCLDPFQLDDISALKCGHTFHDECIKEWIIVREHNDCPVCRMKTHEIIPIFNEGFIFEPLNYNDNNVEVEKRNTFTLKDSFEIIRSKKPFIISSEKKIQYFEFVLLRKGSENPLEIVLQGVDQISKYSNPHRYTYRPEIEINESFGCGLFNHDGKIFLFYKENNEIMIGDITNNLTNFEKSGLRPQIYLSGEGTQLKMQTAVNMPSVEELERIIQRKSAGTSHGISKH